MTIISVTLGSIAALPARPFQWLLYLLALAGMILAHAGTNTLNDVFDFQSGVDVVGAPTTLYRRHPLVEGDFSLVALFGLSVFCYAGAALIGAFFILLRGPLIILLMLIGAFAGIFYTAGPVKYKHCGLGEIVVFLMWGPLMTSASYCIQSKSWEDLDKVLLLSIPQGLWVALVLLANNIKDIDYDGSSRLTTLGTLLGRKKAVALFTFIVLLIYALTLLWIIFDIVSSWALLTTFSARPIAKLIFRFRHEETVPADADPRTAQAGMFYGIALIVSLLLSL